MPGVPRHAPHGAAAASLQVLRTRAPPRMRCSHRAKRGVGRSSPRVPELRHVSRFGIVGLGRMGSNLGLHALELGDEVVAFDQDPESVRRFSAAGGVAAYSLADLVTKLAPPRVILIYVPHGNAVGTVCRDLLPVLESGDVVADCGNSHWAESKKRHVSFADEGIHFLDVGTSGGLTGAREGACFMVGGDKEGFEVVEPLLQRLAVDTGGVFHAGGPGAGHFVKIVHNGIEFAVVQAISEGVALLESFEQRVDIADLLAHWNHGSVIRSWLLELAAEAISSDLDLDGLSGYVEDTGEVKWLLHWAMDRDLPTPVTVAAQTSLMQYRDQRAVQAKMHALLRHAFGGHPLHTTRESVAAPLP